MRTIALALLVVAGLLARPAAAQDFPRAPVRIVVPFPPGGSVDLMARLIGQRLQELWGRPVLTEYKPGSGGLVGTDFVAKAAADGHTVGLVVASHTINPGLRRTIPYDTLKDLAGVTLIASYSQAIAAHPSMPFEDLAGLVEYARRNPGKLAYATPGTGGSSHLTGELLATVAGIELLHVPYKGSAPAHADVMGGRVPLVIDPFYSLWPLARAGKVKIIATTAARRVAGFEQFAPIASLYPSVDVIGYIGMIAPAAVPRPVLARLHADTVRVLAMPEVNSRIVEWGNTPVGSTPEAFDAFIATDMKRWAKVIEDAKIPRE